MLHRINYFEGETFNNGIQPGKCVTYVMTEKRAHQLRESRNKLNI